MCKVTDWRCACAPMRPEGCVRDIEWWGSGWRASGLWVRECSQKLTRPTRKRGSSVWYHCWMLKSGNRVSISIKNLASHPHISGWDSHVQLGWVHNNYVVLPCRFLSSQHQATLKGNATYCEPTLRDMECTSKQAHKLSKILRVCNFATITNKVYTVPQRSKRPLYFFFFNEIHQS